MSDERFVCENDYSKGLILKDNLTGEILEHMNIRGYYHACDKLNELNNEVEEFKKENMELKQQLAKIDRLIDDLGSEEMCRQYEVILNE